MSHQPKNHHWFPQCLMSPWKGSDNQVESLSIQRWGLSSKRKSTKGLGSVNELHRIALLANPNLFEAIFANIETRFAEARQKGLNQGIPALNGNERKNLAFFISLLANRRAKALEAGAVQTAADVTKDLVASLPSADPIAVEHVTDSLGKYVALRAAMEFAAEKSPEIEHLEWRIIDFSSITLKLVLADRPLRVWAEHGKITNLTLPLGPDHLFVAGRFPSHQEIAFRDEFREVLAVQIVGQQFRQAANFVVARTREPYFKMAQALLTAPDQIPPKGTW